MATRPIIHAHDSQQFGDLQLSAQEFYTALKRAVDAYRYPSVLCEVVRLKEGGLFSARREYLRISKERFHYYVSASSFGRSFYISWRLEEEAYTAANITRRFGRLGRAIAAKMEDKTYYELDQALMFTATINAIIKMLVEKVDGNKGYRRKISMPNN